MGNEEVEFKWMLPDEASFAAFLREVGIEESPRFVTQTNHFFDTADLVLRRDGLACRIREEDHGYRLTLKAKGRSMGEGLLTIRPEEEIELDPASARQVLEGARDVREVFFVLAETALGRDVVHVLGDATPIRLGAFHNDRARVGPFVLVEGVEPLVVELDRSTFPDGRVDRELEVEVPKASVPDVEARLQSIAGRLGIPWQTAPSKAARFFAWYVEHRT